MKKILWLLFFIILAFSAKSFAADFDYVSTYTNLEMPKFSYVHGIDPGQYYDNKNASYSIYPLFRLNSPIYFKKITIVPGYYLLTPVENKGENYLLFKENGRVKYTVPVYKKEIVPVDFYETHLPKQKMTFTQKVGKHFYGFIGKHFKSAKRKPAVQSYIMVEDLDEYYVSIIVYYGPYRYYTIYRTVQF